MKWPSLSRKASVGACEVRLESASPELQGRLEAARRNRWVRCTWRWPPARRRQAPEELNCEFGRGQPLPPRLRIVQIMRAQHIERDL